MLNTLFNSTTIPVLEQMANFTSARHNVLAGNIANLDTPGYRARDLSPVEFQSRLREALSERTGASSASRGYNYGGQSNSLDQLTSNFESMLRHDDNDVSVEQQVAELSKNQLQHNLALSILTSQFHLLQAAISERA